MRELRGVSIAARAAEQAVSRRPAGALSASSLRPTNVVTAAVASDAPATIDISTPRATYVPHRLRQNTPSP